MAVKEAKRLGYTEPDPRDDLSGVDFMRKLVILSREVGLRIEMSNVQWSSDPLVSEQMAAMSVEDFMISGLDELSQKMQVLAAGAAKDGKRLAFVGSIDVKSAQVTLGVQAVSKEGPYGSLSGANNIALIFSDYYTDPLVVMGPGAGAKPTASGVVSDVIRPK